MNDLVKNLQEKNYNPCGTLTGREIEICDKARKNFLNLPYSQVMRNIVISEIGSMMPGESFENSSSIKDWSDRTLDDEKLLATVDFDAAEFENFSPLERGFCKFSIHILRENRYNIFYNRLVDYCHELDAEIFDTAEKNGLTFDALEKEIDSCAKEGSFSMTFNSLTDELLNFVMSFKN